MTKNQILLFLLFLFPLNSFASNTCDNEKEYVEFNNTKDVLKNKNASSEEVYHTLSQQVLNNSLDIGYDCYSELIMDVSDARTKMYSYIQNGKKIKASVIYDCDSISDNNQCISKLHADLDWTGRLYARSETILKRPTLRDRTTINFRSDADGFALVNIYLTQVNPDGIELIQPISFDRKIKNSDYTSIPINIKNTLSDKNTLNEPFANAWLFAIYKNHANKSLKVVWYYAGSDFFKQ